VPVQTFDFAFDPRFRGFLRLLGVHPGNASVTLDDEHFDARFGHWRLKTPVSNLKEVRITRDYHWFKAIGARGSATDRGCTFGSNADAGVCVCFHEPVGALIPSDVLRHPGLTVTVADVDGLADAVRQRIAA
jgi:hypothetical protein